MKTYIVYDGRAHYDVDRASVLECIGQTSRKKALKVFKRDWHGHDACLFEYESHGTELVNGQMISFQS